MTDGVVARRVRPESRLDLHLAIERPANQRIFIIKLHSTPLPRSADLPCSAGLEVRRVATGDGVPALHVVLVDHRFTEIFEHLVEDVVTHISPMSDEAAAVVALLARLRRWQAFLRAAGSDGLGPMSQLALYAELWVLRERVAPVTGVATATRSWMGPAAAAQDFQLRHVALEVKATGGKAHEKLHIASERQLDDDGLPLLLLAHVAIDARPGHGESLVDMVTSVRRLASGSGAEHELDARLLEAGYIDAQADRYHRVGFSVRRVTIFKVGTGFPRLVSSDLPPGVGDLTYSIHVSDCMPFAIDPATLPGLMTGPEEPRHVEG